MSPEEYKELRKALGRQKEVAAWLGVSRTTLAHRESGSNPITMEASLAMCYLSVVKMSVEGRVKAVKSE